MLSDLRSELSRCFSGARADAEVTDRWVHACALGNRCMHAFVLADGASCEAHTVMTPAPHHPRVLLQPNPRLCVS